MKKQTKNKLPPQILGLYLGCEVEIEVEPWSSYKPIIVKLTSVDKDGYVQVKNKEGKEITREFERIKLVLRSINDMTEEEIKQCDLLDDRIGYAIMKEDIILMEAEKLIYLTKQKLDVFSLIGSGHAIKKKN